MTSAIGKIGNRKREEPCGKEEEENREGEVVK